MMLILCGVVQIMQSHQRIHHYHDSYLQHERELDIAKQNKREGSSVGGLTSRDNQRYAHPNIYVDARIRAAC